VPPEPTLESDTDLKGKLYKIRYPEKTDSITLREVTPEVAEICREVWDSFMDIQPFKFEPRYFYVHEKESEAQQDIFYVWVEVNQLYYNILFFARDSAGKSYFLKYQDTTLPLDGPLQNFWSIYASKLRDQPAPGLSGAKRKSLKKLYSNAPENIFDLRVVRGRQKYL
jgi:hypothetical protein